MLTWARVPAGACIASALGGQGAAIIAWIVHTKMVYTDVRPCLFIESPQAQHNLATMRNWRFTLSALVSTGGTCISETGCFERV